MSERIKLSIVIVSYNTNKLLKNCLLSVKRHKSEVISEVIVVDNHSVDGSSEMVEDRFPWVKLVRNNSNLGFSKANNKAKNIAKGKYVLFLNSDTVVKKHTFKDTVEYLDIHDDVGSVTCKIVLPNGLLDKDTRRSFPTPWVSFGHLVLKLDRFFPESELFSRYWYGYKDENKTHEVDVIQGAYHLTRKKILDEIGWFDEDYFLDGEDIDLCWKIKKRGWKIVYYPEVKIVHHKKASKKKPQSKKERQRFITSGVDSMAMFYKKNFWDRYPLALNYFVLLGINVVKALRVIKLKIRS